MFDLIVRHATLPDGRENQDIACNDGRITQISEGIDADARDEIDADGYLVSPPFVDGHLHVDAALLHGRPRVNEAGDLYEGIRIWAEAKRHTSIEDYKERARQICAWSIAQGTLFIRCQTDICEPDLNAVRALIAVRDEMKPYITLQIVAFPQDGFLRHPQARQLLLEALDLGAEVVGGIPDYELTTALGNRSIQELCAIAASKNLLVDMHMDQTTDPQSRQIEALTAETIELGLGVRVTASHCPTLSSVNEYYLDKLIDQIAQSEMTIMVQPMQAATCWGLMAPIGKLLSGGVNVALGQDCVLDPWYPFGVCDMLDIAHMAATFGQVLDSKRKRMLFESVTTVGARALGIEDYGLEEGGPADFVILQAYDPEEAIRLRPPRLMVVRGGKVLSRQQKQQASLTLGKQELTVEFARPPHTRIKNGSH